MEGERERENARERERERERQRERERLDYLAKVLSSVSTRAGGRERERVDRVGEWGISRYKEP